MDLSLPLFPLNSVLFPGMLLPLHIFEPRYRVLVRRCIDRDAPFGIVLIRQGEETAAAVPHAVGTTARIVGAAPLPDGRSFIVVRGERRFAIDALVDDEEPYLVGRVRYLAEDEGGDAPALAAPAAERFREYLLAVMTLSDDMRAETPEDASSGTPSDVSYRIAAGLSIPDDELQQLLETERTADRLAAELRLLERETSLVRELVLRRRARGEGATLN